MATFDEMAPWEALRWFDQPKITIFSSAGMTPTMVAPMEPRRVVLILACAQNSIVQVSIDPNMGSSTSISVSPTTPFRLTHGSDGPLVQIPWYAMITGAMAPLAVVEVLLRDWPIPDKQWWESYLAPHEK